MGSTQTEWLSTKDIATRWGCTTLTVGRRLRQAGVEPTRFGRTNYLSPDELAEAERLLGIAGMFRPVAS